MSFRTRYDKPPSEPEPGRPSTEHEAEAPEWVSDAVQLTDGVVDRFDAAVTDLSALVAPTDPPAGLLMGAERVRGHMEAPVGSLLIAMSRTSLGEGDCTEGGRGPVQGVLARPPTVTEHGVLPMTCWPARVNHECLRA